MSNHFQEEDEVLNQRLQQLVKETQDYSINAKSPTERAKRRIALNKLIAAIKNSGKLNKQFKWSSLPNYEDYYNEALQKTFMEICQKIEEYNPQYPVMAWVNQIFNWRFHDVVNKARKMGVTQLPKGREVPRVLSIDELNQEFYGKNEVSESEEIRGIVENDPENFLSGEHIKGQPEANLKTIILLILEGKKWKEISEELDVPMTTASSFYQRRMRKIVPYLKKYI
ncbi:MAG: sigma-70 family RNA polymerase sigma factor [Cyanobacteria bacterium P01_A01_bin.68]